MAEHRKYEKTERVLVNFDKVVKISKKRNISTSTLSKALGRSAGYIASMASGNNKMLYGDLQTIARILDMHGATKLLARENYDYVDENLPVSKETISEMMSDMTTEERTACALEAIAGALAEQVDVLKSIERKLR